MRQALMAAASALMLMPGLAHAQDLAALEAMRSLGAGWGTPDNLGAELLMAGSGDPASEIVHPGERIAFGLSGLAGTSLYVIAMDSEGRLSLLYPNRFETARDKAQAQMKLPGEDAGYAFEISGAPGVEIVKVFAIAGDPAPFEAMLATMFDHAPFRAANAPTREVADVIGAIFTGMSAPGVQVATLEYTIAPEAEVSE